MTLPLALLRCLAGQVMRTLPFRFCVLVCQYAQPALIRYTIIFVIQNRVDSVSVAEGYWILVAACFIYIGLAVCSSSFRYGVQLMETSCRQQCFNINSTVCASCLAVRW